MIFRYKNTFFSLRNGFGIEIVPFNRIMRIFASFLLGVTQVKG